MTQLYEAGVQKITGAAAAAIAGLATGAGARPDIREIGIFNTSGVACTIGIGRPASIGATFTGALGQQTDQADPASGVTLANTFGTAPTAPAVFMRRITLPAVVGAGVVWTWEPQALNVPVSSLFVIWQISTLAVTYDVYVKWEE